MGLNLKHWLIASVLLFAFFILDILTLDGDDIYASKEATEIVKPIDAGYFLKDGKMLDLVYQRYRQLNPSVIQAKSEAEKAEAEKKKTELKDGPPLYDESLIDGVKVCLSATFQKDKALFATVFVQADKSADMKRVTVSEGDRLGHLRVKRVAARRIVITNETIDVELRLFERVDDSEKKL